MPRDRRLALNQNGKRKVVVIIRERGGNPVPAVFNSESQAASFVRARIAKGMVVRADEAASWDDLHERFEVKRISHQEAYRLDGVCPDMAEEYFSPAPSRDLHSRPHRRFVSPSLGAGVVTAGR